MLLGDPGVLTSSDEQPENCPVFIIVDSSHESPACEPARQRYPNLEYPKLGYCANASADTAEAIVKEQYVGDINDYRKYALLRRLQGGNGLRIGVCWMLTPSDGRADGNKTSYLSQPDYERHDPDLYHLLRRVTDGPDHRRLALIEDSGTIPSTIYDNTIVPDPLAARPSWTGRTVELSGRNASSCRSDRATRSSRPHDGKRFTRSFRWSRGLLPELVAPSMGSTAHGPLARQAAVTVVVLE